MKNNRFEQLPLGSVKPKGYLETQLTLQAKNITGNMELYPEFSEKSGWLGGDGENWERGTYYTRGLVGVAYTLNDKALIAKTKKWIDWSINSLKENGDFGANEDLWAKMPMLCAIRDYYLAEKHLGNTVGRVMPFFEKYFRFEEKWFGKNKLSSWAEARGADNAEVVLWYYDECIKNGETEEKCAWLKVLAEKIMLQTQDWEKEMREGGKLRHHVVNTTQGFKHPFIKYRITEDEKCLDSFFKGLNSIYNDHGRIDNLPNADEAARDNLPTRGTETCAVVEGINSLGIGGSISGDSRLYDLMESYAYNNLPNCFDYDLAGYCYFQLENNVMACHGTHGFANDHGDSSSYGISGFECCFSNCHMGYPKFIQNMWLKKGDILVKTCYGENVLTTEINGKKIVFTEMTSYPYNDKITFEYSGEKQLVKLMFRVPEWSSVCKVNGENMTKSQGYVYFEKELNDKDQITLEFKSYVEVCEFHNHSKYLKKGVILFCLPIKEYWREIKDYGYRGVKYDAFAPTKNYEIFPMSDWQYSFDKLEYVYKENDKYDKSKKISPDNSPVFLTVKMNRVNNWELKRNIADTLIGNAVFGKEATEKVLIPTAFSRLKISVFPSRGNGKESKETIVEKLPAFCKKMTEDVCVEKIGDYAFISFSILRNAKYYIAYTDEKGHKRIIGDIKNNHYKFSGDPYGKRIEKDKYSIFIGKSNIDDIKIYKKCLFFIK